MSAAVAKGFPSLLPTLFPDDKHEQIFITKLRRRLRVTLRRRTGKGTLEAVESLRLVVKSPRKLPITHTGARTLSLLFSSRKTSARSYYLISLSVFSFVAALFTFQERNFFTHRWPCKHSSRRNFLRDSRLLRKARPRNRVRVPYQRDYFSSRYHSD